MCIYHRHEEPDTRSSGAVQCCQRGKPGTCRRGKWNPAHYRGISFFMSLPGPSDPLTAFEFMLETAQCVVRNLGGELKDERMSVMTRPDH